MENWNQRILLGAALWAGCSITASAEESSTPIQVISPEVDRREITVDAIDTENFEVGAYVGILSIQDFDAAPVYGVRAAWHINEDFFFEANVGTSEGDLTSYEKLSGGAPLFEDDERDYSYYNLNLGWNALPGEIFFFGGRAMKSDLYFVGGVGSTEFLDDSWFTVTVGAGYRLLLNDWLTWRIDVRDHIFDRDTFGEDETTNNIELSTGITFFF
ncbi:MAG: outer membrane beta-barrel domain-containing protein [Halioglobus sp.]